MSVLQLHKEEKRERAIYRFQGKRIPISNKLKWIFKHIAYYFKISNFISKGWRGTYVCVLGFFVIIPDDLKNLIPRRMSYKTLDELYRRPHSSSR